MRVRFSLLAIVLFILCCTFGSAKVIHSGNYHPTETFEYEGESIKVLYYDSQNKVSLEVTRENGMFRYILDEGECSGDSQKEYCYDSKCGEDYEDGEIIYCLQISIRKDAPDIVIERTISEKTPGIGEETTINAVIKNNGDKRAYNLRFYEEFPYGFSIISTNGRREANKVIWEGNLDAGAEHDLDYVIKPTMMIEHEAIAYASFAFDGEIHEVASSAISIKTKLPFEMEQNISKLSPEVGEQIEYSITLTNNDDSTPLVIKELRVKFPDGVNVYSTPEGFERDGKHYVYEGSLDADTSRTMRFTLAGLKRQEYVIEATIETLFKGNTFKDSMERMFGIGVSSLEPILKIEPLTLKEFDDFTIYAAIKNRADYDISGISGYLSSQGIFKRINFEDESIDSGGVLELYDRLKTAKDVSRIDTFIFTLFGSYHDDRLDKDFDFEKSLTLTIEPQKEVMAYSIETEPDVARRGGEMKVTAYVRNLVNEPLEDVDVVDTLPVGVNVLSGKNYGKTNLDPFAKAQAFSYVVKVSEDYHSGVIDINTILNAKYNGKLIKKEEKTLLPVSDEAPIREVKDDDDTKEEKEDVDFPKDVKEEDVKEEDVKEEDVKEEDVKEEDVKEEEKEVGEKDIEISEEDPVAVKVVKWFKQFFKNVTNLFYSEVNEKPQE